MSCLLNPDSSATSARRSSSPPHTNRATHELAKAGVFSLNIPLIPFLFLISPSHFYPSSSVFIVGFLFCPFLVAPFRLHPSFLCFASFSYHAITTTSPSKQYQTAANRNRIALNFGSGLRFDFLFTPRRGRFVCYKDRIYKGREGNLDSTPILFFFFLSFVLEKGNQAVCRYILK